ncbi:MAG TPA: 4Fe-4S binding protein [Opitutaceae bacterium]|nr:4Fe-4S binding protein [Opitutaceae bacterium]
MLRKLRIAAALLCFAPLTLLFLDFTGTAHRWFGWLAKVQFLPALLAANLAIVAALVLLTLLFGRIYCSTLCPLGVFQDVVSWISGRRKKNRFSPSPERRALRYGTLAIFAVLLLGGFGSVFALLDPYGAYGRMVASLLGPVYGWGNNLLARLAARADSYAFYSVDVWLKGAGTLAVAAATFAALAVLTWRNGRTYCNTLCPVGTILGTLSRFSLLKPRIAASRCNRCGLCACNCKAACIDPAASRVDYSRCVVCLNCTVNCRKGALTYTLRNHA